MNKQIVLNRIKTPDGTVLESYHRHDYKEHKDKNGLVYMVDGGREYLRRIQHKDAPYIEMSVYSDAPFEELRTLVKRGGRGKDGKQPLKWVPISEMSNEWLEACIVYNEALGISKDTSFDTLMYHKELEYRKENNIHIGDVID